MRNIKVLNIQIVPLLDEIENSTIGREVRLIALLGDGGKLIAHDSGVDRKKWRGIHVTHLFPSFNLVL
jgi:hypothetical protein